MEEYKDTKIHNIDLPRCILDEKGAIVGIVGKGNSMISDKKI